MPALLDRVSVGVSRRAGGRRMPGVPRGRRRRPRARRRPSRAGGPGLRLPRGFGVTGGWPSTGSRSCWSTTTRATRATGNCWGSPTASRCPGCACRRGCPDARMRRRAGGVQPAAARVRRDEVETAQAVADLVGLRRAPVRAAPTPSTVPEPAGQRGRRTRCALQEAERRRIAGDLHDGVTQAIASLSFHLSAAQSALHDGDIADVAPRSTRPGALADLAFGETRSAITGLRSPMLDDLGLAAGLASLARDVPNLPIRVDAQDLPLPDHVATSLFRVAQEAVHNIVKHAARQRRRRPAGPGTAGGHADRHRRRPRVRPAAGAVPGAPRRAPRGLRGMAERVRLWAASSGSARTATRAPRSRYGYPTSSDRVPARESRPGGSLGLRAAWSDAHPTGTAQVGAASAASPARGRRPGTVPRSRPAGQQGGLCRGRSPLAAGHVHGAARSRRPRPRFGRSSTRAGRPGRRPRRVRSRGPRSRRGSGSVAPHDGFRPAGQHAEDRRGRPVGAARTPRTGAAGADDVELPQRQRPQRAAVRRDDPLALDLGDAVRVGGRPSRCRSRTRRRPVSPYTAAEEANRQQPPDAGPGHRRDEVADAVDVVGPVVPGVARELRRRLARGEVDDAGGRVPPNNVGAVRAGHRALDHRGVAGRAVEAAGGEAVEATTSCRRPGRWTTCAAMGPNPPVTIQINVVPIQVAAPGAVVEHMFKEGDGSPVPPSRAVVSGSTRRRSPPTPRSPSRSNRRRGVLRTPAVSVSVRTIT